MPPPAVRATDGSMGKLSALYLDDKASVIRRLVVETGIWLPEGSIALESLLLRVRRLLHAVATPVEAGGLGPQVVLPHRWCRDLGCHGRGPAAGVDAATGRPPGCVGSNPLQRVSPPLAFNADFSSRLRDRHDLRVLLPALRAAQPRCEGR